MTNRINYSKITVRDPVRDQELMMKIIRYFKFAFALFLFELMVGKIGYEYGYSHGGSVSGIGWYYVFAIYAFVYCVICFLQGWDESALSVDIFSTVYLGVPFMIVLIFTLTNEMIARELPFAATTLTVFGAMFALGLSILILQIRKKSAEKCKKEI